MTLRVTHFDTVPDGVRYLIEDQERHKNIGRFVGPVSTKARRVLGDDFVRIESYDTLFYLVIRKGTSKRNRQAWRDLLGWIRLEWNI